MKRQAGFTLVELMVAAALLVIVVVYLTATFTENHRTYEVVTDTIEAQQSLRAIGALMEREVRHAGFMVPGAAAACAVDNTNAPDVLYLSDAAAIDPTGLQSPDVGAEPEAATPYDGGVGDVIGFASLLVEGSAFYDTDGDGTADSDFQPDGGVIITDYENPERGRACGRVTAVDPGTNRITVDWETALAAHNGATMGPEDLLVVPAHRYELDAAALRLERNGQLLATDIEDLQVAFFYDEDGDGVPDANEYPGADGEPTYDPGALDLYGDETLREIRLNLVARSHDSDPDQEYSGGEFQPTENRVAPAGSDGFRRRVHTATLRVRNVGGRSF